MNKNTSRKKYIDPASILSGITDSKVKRRGSGLSNSTGTGAQRAPQFDSSALKATNSPDMKKMTEEYQRIARANDPSVRFERDEPIPADLEAIEMSADRGRRGTRKKRATR